MHVFALLKKLFNFQHYVEILFFVYYVYDFIINK